MRLVADIALELEKKGKQAAEEDEEEDGEEDDE